MEPEKIGIYEIKSELGRGGMATVYRGWDPRFEREVVVKVLRRELLHSDPQFRLRFEREAKIISQLEHSAIVPVYDVGESDGQPYYVMRYMNGGSLSERIKAGPLSIIDATRIMEEIGPALDEAHIKGIVHRDIKPSNILFNNRGNPHISDFGIAKLLQAQAGDVEGSAIIGTPAYMAPEQAQGADVDGRVDIYALGIILYEMLTGKQPYEADTPMAVALKHITDPVPHILTANPKLPEGMETIIQKAMAKNRENRYSTVQEMVNDLRLIAQRSPSTGVLGSTGATQKTTPSLKADSIDQAAVDSVTGKKKQQNPYVGPRTFSPDEAHLFFGREREARELLALVESERLVVFYAQSGAGKSSLVNTCLINDLRKKRYPVFIGRVSGEAPANINVANIYIYNLLYGLSSSDYTDLSTMSLGQFLPQFIVNQDASGSERVVLIIDDFEELFSTHAEAWANREEYFKQLAQALQDDPQLWVVLVMREDYIASLDPYAQLVPNGFRARYSMQRLGREAALQAVKYPAEKLRPYASGVAEKLVDELSSIRVQRPDGTFEVQRGQYVEPVQLQVVCYTLWNNLPADGTQITERDLQAVGDINQSLGRYYNQRVQAVAQAEQVNEGLIREWFEKQLITAGGIRNLVLQEPEKSGGLDNSVIRALQSDLVRAEQRGGAIWFELTHDRLVEPIIASNRRWFDVNLNPLQRQAVLWNDQGRSESWLLGGQALADVETWAKEHPDELTDVDREFLEASRKRQAQIGEGQAAAPEQADSTLQPNSDETVAETDTTTTVVEETEAERDIRLQAAIAANLLANNRSQAVFNDRAQGEDQLGIKDEVEALAETLLLRDVEPPVAVGILGGWGSGKSFVMYLINQYVQSTRAKKVDKGWADGVENDPKIPAFVGHVYQINFNAWTYAKSNLWASLMDTIFSKLNRQMQLERLFAYHDLAATEKLPEPEAVQPGLMRGGEIFKKIYLEDYQIHQDSDLTPELKQTLEFWSNKLLSHNLLWQVMRNQNKAALKTIREDEEKLEQYKARRAALEQSRETDAVSLKALDPLAKPDYFALLQTTMLTFVSDTLSKTTRENLKKKDIQADDLLALKHETESLIKGSRGLVLAFRQNKYYWFAALSIAAMTIAFSYVWEMLGQPLVNTVITKSAAIVTAILPIIPTLLARWRKILDFEVETRKALENAHAAQRTRVAEEIASSDTLTAAEKIKRLDDEIKKGSLPACDVLIRLKENQIEQQRLKIGPAAKYSSLLEFVQSRLDAATYENQLGLMHQVRQDIDELTYSLVDNANQDVFPRGKPRVILYIDDLDRCPPSRVVEVLEAVQLLLNTKLFIVILGLDTRYVTRALEKEYKEILQHEGDPSGLDYIEKIIQIPYRVRSIDVGNLRKYIEKQMDIEKVIEQMKATESPPAQPQQESIQTDIPTPGQPSAEIKPALEQVVAEVTQSPSDHENTESKVPSPEQPVAPDIQRPESPVEVKVQELQLAEAPKPESLIEPGVQAPKQPEPEPPVEQKPKAKELPPIELPAAVIQFKQEDLEDLAACCQKIALTPRTIKRLINVFKLMKIFWFRADKNAGIIERDRPRPVKQAAMSLLALSSAYPEVMREVFVHLETLYRQGREQTELFTALNTIILPPGSTHDLASQLKKYKGDIVALQAIRGTGQDKFGQLTLQNLKLSTFNIVRSFSFVGDPVYWTDGEDDTPRSKALEPEKKVSVPRIKTKKRGN